MTHSPCHVANYCHFLPCCYHGDYNMNWLPGILFHILLLVIPLPSSPFWLLPPSAYLFGMKGRVSASLLFSQSQSVADPSSEGDYPSISISHTLISHVSLWSFVSATPHPEWRDFSLLAYWEVLAYTVGAIFRKSSHVWSKANAFHRLWHGVIFVNFHFCYNFLIGVLVCSQSNILFLNYTHL